MFFKIKKQKENPNDMRVSLGRRFLIFQLLALLLTNKRTTRQIFNHHFLVVFFFFSFGNALFLVVILSKRASIGATIRFFKFLVLLLETITNNVEQSRITITTSRNTLSKARFSNGILEIEKSPILPVHTANVDLFLVSVLSPLSLK